MPMGNYVVDVRTYKPLFNSFVISSFHILSLCTLGLLRRLMCPSICARSFSVCFSQWYSLSIFRTSSHTCHRFIVHDQLYQIYHDVPVHLLWEKVMLRICTSYHHIPVEIEWILGIIDLLRIIPHYPFSYTAFRSKICFPPLNDSFVLQFETSIIRVYLFCIVLHLHFSWANTRCDSHIFHKSSLN